MVKNYKNINIIKWIIQDLLWSKLVVVLPPEEYLVIGSVGNFLNLLYGFGRLHVQIRRLICDVATLDAWD
jgi:hypothetical protein